MVRGATSSVSASCAAVIALRAPQQVDQLEESVCATHDWAPRSPCSEVRGSRNTDGAQKVRGKVFTDLHSADGIFVMPNAWNAGSACMLEQAGFPAVGTPATPGAAVHVGCV